ncbi:unnamed protein product, partial [Lymnaea stagnalis]
MNRLPGRRTKSMDDIPYLELMDNQLNLTLTSQQTHTTLSDSSDMASPVHDQNTTVAQNEMDVGDNGILKLSHITLQNFDLKPKGWGSDINDAKDISMNLNEDESTEDRLLSQTSPDHGNVKDFESEENIIDQSIASQRSIHQQRFLREKSPSDSDIMSTLIEADLLDQRSMSADHVLKWQLDINRSSASEDSIWYLFANKSMEHQSVKESESPSTLRRVRSFENFLSSSDGLGHHRTRSADSIHTNSSLTDSSIHRYKGYNDPNPPVFERAASLDNIYQQKVRHVQKEHFHRSRSADMLDAGNDDDENDQIFPPAVTEVDTINIIDNSDNMDEDQFLRRESNVS